MGQYFKLVNLDKKEVVNAWDLGGSVKFYEWAYDVKLGAVLMYLIRKSNGIGGGDIQADIEKLEFCGRWAGDRIALVGDYDDSELYYADKKNGFRDISKDLAKEFNKVMEKEAPELVLDTPE